MISHIKENDIDSLINALVGKFGWSEKDPDRKFYLQNVIIGTVSHETITDKLGNKHHWIIPLEENYE